MPQFVGQKVVVHNGQHFFPINIKEEMVGHKFGEFSFTKKKPIHKKKNN
jgi:ribosomal protein S19